MTRTCRRWGWLWAVVLCVTACADSRGSNESTVKTLLTKQADAWDRAIVGKDAAAVAANMSDDFRHMAGNGVISGKAAFLADILSPDLQIDPYTVDNFEIRIYGDTALLSGRTRMTGRSSGQAFVSHYQYVDTYVRRDGVWRVVNVQITRLPD